MKRAIVGSLTVFILSTAIRIIAHEFGIPWEAAGYVDDLMGTIVVGFLLYQADQTSRKHQSFEDHVRNAYQIIRFLAEFEVDHKEYLLGAVSRFEKAMKSLHGERNENVECANKSDVQETFAGRTSRDSHVRDASKPR